MLNEDLIRLINRQEDFITKAENGLLEGMTRIERKLFRRVKEQLNQMNKEGGKFTFDDSNVDLVNQLDQIMIDELQNSSYPGDVRDYLQNFDTVTDFQADLHSSLNQISPDELRNLVDPFKRQIVDDTLQGLTGSGVATEFVEPVRQELFKNIVAGANSTDIEKALRVMIEGDASRLGGLQKYVGQVTRDSLNQYEGQVNAKIADQYNLDAFEYVGSLVEDSRSQCRHWVEKRVLTLEELPQLITNAYTTGQGMIPGTTAQNFAVFRGGYNCRHSAIPFKMTKREKERLEGKQEEVEKKEPTPTVDASLDGATRAERELRLTYGESKLVPTNLRGEGVPDQVFILSDNGKNRITKAKSWYQPGDKTVRVALKGRRYGTDNVSGRKKVIVHEFGHRTHFERGFFTYDKSAPNHLKAWNKSKELINERIRTDDVFRREMSNFTKVRDKYFEKFKDRGYTQKEISEMVAAFTDTVEAATAGRYGFGHGRKYFNYRNGVMQPFEWYAHAAENYFVGNPVFQDAFPELFDQMNDYFSKEVIMKTEALKPFIK